MTPASVAMSVAETAILRSWMPGWGSRIPTAAGCHVPMHTTMLSWRWVQGSHPLLPRPAFLLIVESTKPQIKQQALLGCGLWMSTCRQRRRSRAGQESEGTVPVVTGAAQQRRLLATLASLDWIAESLAPARPFPAAARRRILLSRHRRGRGAPRCCSFTDGIMT